MKAEQRKELETNTLADKMGQAMQRVRTSPRRTFLTYFIVIAVVVVGVWFGWHYWTEDKAARSEQWIKLYDGRGDFIDDLAHKQKETNAGKAARFQEAWLLYWDLGVKMLATDKAGSLIRLKEAVKRYGELADDCKDDKIFEPQALLGKACAEESRAVQHRDHLDQAKVYYEAVVDKYKDTAEGIFAKKRLDVLSDKDSKRELAASYDHLQDLLGVPPRAPAQFMPGGGPGGPDGLPPFLKGKDKK